MKKLIVTFLAVFTAASGYGAFSIQLDAGELRANSTTGLPVGSVLLFISAGADGVFETPTSLMPGSYVAGDDVLLSVMSDPSSAQAFNTAVGTNETLNLFTITSAAPPDSATPPAGQAIGLLWFSQITYSQWQAGTTPTAGQTFGFYNPSFWGNGTNNPDGGNAWVVPASGLVNLNFFTTDSDAGGTQTPNRGFGNNFFVAIPEPSTFALMIAGAVGFLALRSRSRR
ncbi:MAG: hypothetical protein QOH39_3104 [Verrucomicrobiota bacterium]|jgi:hypothetical protein